MKTIRNSILKKHRTFFKFLISYLLILIVPIIVFNGIYSNFLVKTLKNEVTKNNVSALVMSKSLMDKEIQQVHGISYKILYMNKNIFNYYNQQKNRVSDKEISNELKYSIISNLAIEEIALYTKGNPTVYTSSGNYSVDSFFNYIYPFENYTSQDFIKDTNTINKIHIIPELSIGSSQKYIAAIYPAPTFTQKPDTFLIYFIKENYLMDYMDFSSNINNNYSFIVDLDSKNIISSLDPYAGFDGAQLTGQILSVKNEGFKNIAINGSDYYIFVADSNILPWRYASLIPAQNVLDKINSSAKLIYIGLIFAVLLGSICIFYFMTINYIPIKQMSNNIEKVFQMGTSPKLNEMEIVKQGIKYLSEENISLSNKFKANIPKVRDSLLMSVLKGQIETLQEFNECGRDIGLSFDYSNFQVVIIMSDSSELTRQDIYECIDDNNDNKMTFYCVDRIEKNQFIVIVNSNECDNDRIIELLESVMEDVKVRKDCILTIGIGNIYTNINRITMSYIEASNALKHKFVKGYGQIIDISELTNNSDIIKYYPKKELELLKECIKLKNFDGLNSCVDDIVVKIVNSKMPIFMAQGICIDIINMIMQMDQLMLTNSFYPDLFFIESADSVDKLLNLVKGICSNINNAKEDKSLKEVVTIGEISNYINNNFSKCDFSIQEVSDYFDMKLSYMSQFYKSQTNQTMMDYVTMLRVEKAKKLLTTTPMSLSYIAEEVGYYNVSSFIRRFKQVTGLPPGEFRKGLHDS